MLFKLCTETETRKKLNPDFELNFDLLTSCTENCNTEQNKDIILAVLRYEVAIYSQL